MRIRHLAAHLSLLAACHLPVAVRAQDQVRPELAESETRPEPLWITYADQGANDPRLKGYRSAGGLRVEVVAEEPVVANPVAMTFGDDGTLFVVEWRGGGDQPPREEWLTFTYRDGSTRKVLTVRKGVKDVIKALRDTDGDGEYDRAEVVLEEELPSGILVHDGWLYVSGRGTVRRYRQSKPGGAYDQKEVIAQGFSGYHTHQVSGLAIGDDGWLYVTAGDGDNHVEGSDGSRATVLRTGAVFRCRPDGSKMHVFAVGFRNPMGNVAFDAEGNVFHADHGHPEGGVWAGTRLMHVAEGDDFGWRRSPGQPGGPPDRLRLSLLAELSGSSPPLLRTGRGFPTGLFVYRDTLLPFEYRGLLYYPDALRRRVRAYTLVPRGSGFEAVEQFDFLASDDPLFRPRQMATGPDGAIYLLDQRTDLRGVVGLGAGSVRPASAPGGRIYRISWSGTKDLPAIKPRPAASWADVQKAGDEDVLKAVVSEDETLRRVARAELVRRGGKNRKQLLALLGEPEVPEEGRVAVLGVLLSMWDGEVQEACESLVQNGESTLRKFAIEVLGLYAEKGDKSAHNVLLGQLGDSDPAVRRSVALALARVGAPGAEEALVNTLSFDEGKDPGLQRGLVRAIESLGKPGIERLLALFESGVKRDADRVVEAFLTMRTAPAAEAIPRVLRYPHLSIEQRQGLVQSHANYLLDPPLSLAPLLEYLTSQPNEAEQVQMAGLAVLSLDGTRPGEQASRWLLGLLDKENADLRIAAVNAIREARIATAVPVLVELLADNARPVTERRAILRALAHLGDRSAVDAVERGLTAEGNARLLVEGLRTLEALDPQRADAVARKFVRHADHLVQKEAISILGATLEGARLLGEMHKEERFTDELLPTLSHALAKWTPRDEALARTHRELIQGKVQVHPTPDEIGRLSKLVETNGNSVRGREIYVQKTKLACAQCHRFEDTGRALGPELTRLWQTHSAGDVLQTLLDPDGNPSIDNRTHRVATKNGRTYVGLVVRETPDAVHLIDAAGREIRVGLKDIQARTSGPGALSSKQAIAALSEEELVHLVAFLIDRKAQESLRHSEK